MCAMRTPSSSQKQGNSLIKCIFFIVFMLFQLTKSMQTAEHCIQKYIHLQFLFGITNSTPVYRIIIIDKNFCFIGMIDKMFQGIEISIILRTKQIRFITSPVDGSKVIKNIINGKLYPALLYFEHIS